MRKTHYRQIGEHRGHVGRPRVWGRARGISGGTNGRKGDRSQTMSLPPFDTASPIISEETPPIGFLSSNLPSMLARAQSRSPRVARSIWLREFVCRKLSGEKIIRGEY